MQNFENFGFAVLAGVFELLQRVVFGQIVLLTLIDHLGVRLGGLRQPGGGVFDIIYRGTHRGAAREYEQDESAADAKLGETHILKPSPMPLPTVEKDLGSDAQ
jgi:hypothetical protein